MITNVSTLLREFPKVRRAALAGEDVIIKTREGNLRLVADQPVGVGILGAMKGQITRSDDSIAEPTTMEQDWSPSL
jgi:hypothetical protein